MYLVTYNSKSGSKQYMNLRTYNISSTGIIEYTKNEALDPRRMLTSSVLVKNGEWPLVSVKSSNPVPKEKIFSVLKEIKKKIVIAPVKTGQIILKNVANTKIDIIATKTINKLGNNL